MRYVYLPMYGGRSHPEKNVKVNSEEELRKWFLKDIENNRLTYFISFTDLDRIGLNPQFSYRNVIGVYTYPLRPVYKRQTLDVSFASDRKYIQVLKVTVPQSSILDSDNYDEFHYKRDVQKLRFIFDKYKHFFDYDRIKEHSRKLKSSVVFNLENVTSFDGLFYLVEANYKYLRTISSVYSSQCKKRLKKNPYFRRIWILSMLISVLLTKKNHAITWNHLLQQLGYKVVIDNNTGTLYYGQPKQAVFLSKDSYTLVDTLENNLLPTWNFLSLLRKKKVAYFEDEQLNKITVSGDIKISNLKVMSLPIDLEVDGELKLFNSHFISQMSSLKANILSMQKSYFCKFPETVDLNTLTLVDQKLQALPAKARIESAGIVKSTLGTIKSGAEIGLLLLKNSTIKTIEDGVRIDRIVMDSSSKIIKCPEYLRNIISYTDLSILDDEA